MDVRNGGGEGSSTSVANQPAADLTRNQDDAQNSNSSDASAAHASAPSKAASRTSSTRNSTPAATSLEVQPVRTNGATSNLDPMQDSQDMPQATAAPAHSASKDSEENGAVPYGTRSRNRPGRSRPNYAEDPEMEFETTAATANGRVSDPPSRDSAAAESAPPPSNVSGKKGSGSAPSNASWGNSGPNPKDNPATANIPGASSTVATQASTAQPTTKRRKNAATTNGTHANASAPSQAGAKRGSHVVAVANGARESNMMTFENTGAMLINGRLEADDGQTVSVDGEF
jgi:hypothetical protein